jgi:hypothetical protein
LGEHQHPADDAGQDGVHLGDAGAPLLGLVPDSAASPGTGLLPGGRALAAVKSAGTPISAGSARTLFRTAEQLTAPCGPACCGRPPDRRGSAARGTRCALYGRRLSLLRPAGLPIPASR